MTCLDDEDYFVDDGTANRTPPAAARRCTLEVGDPVGFRVIPSNTFSATYFRLFMRAKLDLAVLNPAV
jgi:hypothetical protein